MSETGVSPPEGEKKKFQFGMKQKTILSLAVLVIALGIGVNSSVQYEAHRGGGTPTTHPPPTYTGSQPLAIGAMSEATKSNNDFILVITPCNDDALNTSVTNTVVTAGDKIRTTDRIYVGVFTLPKNTALSYPTVTLRYLAGESSGVAQFTMREDITVDKIFDNYLSRKFLR